MSRIEPDVETLIAQARSEARAEVLARLRQRFVDELLGKVESALGETSRTAISLVGVVPVESALDGITCGRVKALVTQLDARELEDAQALECHVRAHNDVLLGALETPVVPIRFGTLFADAADVGAWLERNEAALLDELRQLQDAGEWAVTIAQKEQLEPELVAAGAYLERRLAAGEEAARRARLLGERAEPWHERLAAHADAAVRNTGSSIALEAAYLVRRGQQQEFDAAVLELQDELGDDFEFRLTGPWPPFSFVSKHLQ
jgi:hypothetical protein